MVYQWKDGTRFKGSAQPVGERLAELTEERGGHVTPSEVVDDARPDDSPLHPHFEWDDEEAAERYREDQARQLIRSVYVVHETPDGKHKQSLGYIHVELPNEGPAYVTTARCVSETQLYQQAKEEALRAFKALQKRYSHIGELAKIFEAIETVERDQIRQIEAEQPQSKRKRA